MAAKLPYVLTHVNTDDVLIKIWGVVDRDRHILIQNVIDIHAEKLAQGLGAADYRTNLMPGKLVLVHHGNRFKRALVIRADSGSPNRKVLVRLVDSGPVISVRFDEIRDISEIPHLRALEDSPLAEDFILYGVIKSGPWNVEDSEWANRVLLFNSEISFVDAVANKILLNIAVNDSRSNVLSYSACLMKRGIAEGVSLEQQTSIICNKYGSQMLSNQFQVPPPIIPNMMNSPRQPYSYMMPTTNSPTPQTMPSRAFNYAETRSPRPYLPPQAPSQPAPNPQILPCQFGVETLKPGSTHEVYVSHVIEGMQSFTVQLKKNVDEKLTKLMAQINSMPTKLISSALLPGTMCLGKAAEDKTLCRAVVSTVLGEGANLYFVDFGNSEIVPFNEIYEIPPEFIQENVMALRFTLANLSNNYALSTQEAQRIFEDLVENAEKLMMQVMQPEMPLKQYCELFLVDRGKAINVKQKVLDKVKLMKPAEYKKILFKQNSVADVLISYVESPIRFFIQLDVNQSMLEILMNTVEEYCVNSDMKELLYVEDVNENMAVCALYSADQKWYRGLIMDEPDGDGNVQVFYVDYGNQEACHFSNLRIMNNEMISKFPMQAIECRLDIDADFALREDVVSFFVDLVDANTYTMKVLNVLPAHVLLVELKSADNVNVKDMLLKQFNQNSPVAPLSEPSAKQATFYGNWRERNNSSNEGDFSSFHQESTRSRSDTPPRNSYDSEEGRSKLGKRRNFNGVDEIDNTVNRSDNFWGQDTRESRGRFKSGPTSDRPFKSHDDWRSNKEDQEDDSTDSKAYGKRGSKDDLSSYRDSNSGGNTLNWRRGSEDGRNKRDEGSDRKPFFKKRDDDSRTGNWDSDSGGRKPFRKRDDDDTWNTNRDDERSDRRGGFRKNDRDSNRDNDRADRKYFRSNDHGSKDDDWGANKASESDDWHSKPKFDRGNRGADSWSTKPRFDRDSRGQDDSRRGGGFRQGSDNFGEKKWGSRDSSFKTPTVTLMDGYEKGANFINSNFERDHQIEVVISWFMNPSQFFVMPADNPEFRSLMETIQTDYPQRKPTGINSLQPNDSVVARDKDNVIYRAKVLRTRPGAVLVSFVDYGNVASVSQDQVWTISSEHCNIPVQAVCCGLYNVSPADENGQWSLATDLDKYFGKEKYTLTFIECRDETSSKTWFVNLVDENGKDIAESMVADGLAVRNTVLQSEELYDLSLLRNQVLTVFPGHIESSKKFFVHIEPHKANSILQMIMDLTANPNDLTPLPADKYVEGEFCLAPSDDEVYYRALILSVDESSQQAHVVYIDYGDENDINLDKIKVLPDSLMIYNSQFVECCLYEGESFTDEEAFLEAISETDFMIKVIDVVEDKLLVYVYDINGTRLPFPSATEETVSAICALPVLKRFEKVAISHIAKDKVYVLRAADEPFMLDLSEKLNNKYNEAETEKVSMEPDVYYAANSAKFEAWYRCKLANAESTEVFYIDYGNTEPIADLLAVKVLEKDFFIFPAFATAVSTNIQFTVDDLTPLMDAVKSVFFDAVFERGATENELLADLKDCTTGKNFVQFAVESGCGSEIKKSESQLQSYVAFADWQLDTEKKVIVSHVSSPTSFYLQLFDDIDKIATMQQNLQSALRKLLPVVGPLEGLCAAQKADRSWYRARVSQKGKLAFAVDFGSEFTPQAVKRLPKSYLLDTSSYVAECALNIEPVGDVWDESTPKRLAEITKNGNEIIAKLEYVKNNKKIVDLIVDSINVGEMFINEELARHKSFKVLVSHVVSLKEFYIQELEFEEQLFDLADKLKEADNWDTVEASVGEVVAAKFIDDELWYRAVIVKAEDDGKIVRFIDYGNESPCEEFRALPEGLKSMPSFAAKCLQHPLPENSDELTDKFIDLVASGEGSFSVYFLSHIEPKLVMLYFNDVSIDEALQQPVAELPESEPIAELSQPKLESSAENCVIVSHVNSPSSFYTQAFDDTLTQIETSLINIENAEDVTEPNVGDIVAALFPEDGIWYRAKVTDTSDGAIAVFFVDYGNSCVVEQLKKLEEKVKTLPFLAKHCTLQLQNGLEDWSEEANKRFVELTAQGATTFNLIVKEDGYPTVVDLLNDGSSVTDELAALSKVEAKTSDVVAVCHIKSPSSFYVQAENAALDEVAAVLADIETNQVVAEPAVGDLVAALFPEDGVWHRAEITDISDTSITVFFVDFGNSCVVDQLRNLSEEAKVLPYLAKHCAFSLPTGLEQWPEAAKQRLAELTDNGNTIFKLIVQEEGNPAYVDLQENGVSVADELATLCKADLSTPAQEAKTPLATLSHVRSSLEIWIQYQTPHLDEMMNEMASAETFDTLERAAEGDLVAAVFVDDGLWYRAKVLDVKENEYRILFIDYGNEADTTVIRSLPEDLISLPPLAKRCRLVGLPRDVESHPENMFTKLKEMENSAQVFSVTESNRDGDGDVTFVSLSYDGKDLLTELMGGNEAESVFPSTSEDQPEKADARSTEDTVADKIVADFNHDGETPKQKQIDAAESVSGICENHREDLSEVTKTEAVSQAESILEENLTKISNGSDSADESTHTDDEKFDSVSSGEETFCTVQTDVAEEIFVDDSNALVDNNAEETPTDRVTECCETVSCDLADDKEKILVEHPVDQNKEENFISIGSFQKTAVKTESTETKKYLLDEVDTTMSEDSYSIASKITPPDVLQTTIIEVDSNKALVESNDESNAVLSIENIADRVSSVAFSNVESSNDIIPSECKSISKDVDETAKEVAAEKPDVAVELKADTGAPALELELTIEKQSVDVEFQKPLDSEANDRIERKSEFCSADEMISRVADPARVVIESPVVTSSLVTEQENNQTCTKETGASSAVQEVPSTATDGSMNPSSEITAPLKVPAVVPILGKLESTVVNVSEILSVPSDIKKVIEVPVDVTENVEKSGVSSKPIECTRTATQEVTTLEKPVSYDEFEHQEIEKTISTTYRFEEFEKGNKKTEPQKVIASDEVKENEKLGQHVSISSTDSVPSKEAELVQEKLKSGSKIKAEIAETEKIDALIPVTVSVETVEKSEANIVPSVPAFSGIQKAIASQDKKMEEPEKPVWISSAVSIPSEENYESTKADSAIDESIEQKTKSKSKVEVEISKTSFLEKPATYDEFKSKEIEKIMPVTVLTASDEKVLLSIPEFSSVQGIVASQNKMEEPEKSVWISSAVKADSAIDESIQKTSKSESKVKVENPETTCPKKSATYDEFEFKKMTLRVKKLEESCVEVVPSVSAFSSVRRATITSEVKEKEKLENPVSTSPTLSQSSKEKNESTSTEGAISKPIQINEKFKYEEVKTESSETYVFPVVADTKTESSNDFETPISAETVTSEVSQTLKYSQVTADGRVESSREIATIEARPRDVLEIPKLKVVKESAEVENSSLTEALVLPVASTDHKNIPLENTENQHSFEESNTSKIKEGVSLETDWFSGFLNVSDLIHKHIDSGSKNSTAAETSAIPNQEIENASFGAEKLGDSGSSVYFDSSSDAHFLSDNSLDQSSCLVTAAENPSSFYVSLFPQLKVMEEKLREVSETVLEVVKIGMTAGARIQNIPLRVKVIDSDTYNGFTVFCIDYGTEATCPSLFKLPSELADTPPLALHCAIQLPCFLREWPEDVCQRFDCITRSSEQKFNIQVVEVGDEVLFVNLFKDGIDIGEELRAMCDDFGEELELLESSFKEG